MIAWAPAKEIVTSMMKKVRKPFKERFYLDIKGDARLSRRCFYIGVAQFRQAGMLKVVGLAEEIGYLKMLAWM